MLHLLGRLKKTRVYAEAILQVKPTKSKNILKEAIINCLSSIPIFADLNPAELNTISDHMHVSRFEAGDLVFSEGDPGDEVCFVTMTGAKSGRSMNCALWLTAHWTY